MLRQTPRKGLPCANSKIDFNRPFILAMGPQRCATSWLDSYLRQRGDLCLPEKIKEIGYFDAHHDRGAKFYKRHFRPAANHSAVMEVTTTYFDHPHAPERVYNAFGPDLKLLCPLRHPVSRSYLLYLHYLRYSLVKGTLREACEQNPQILTSSHYAKHIQNWLKYFSADQITFTFQEDLEADTAQYIQSPCEALNIEQHQPSPKQSYRRLNATISARYSLLAAGAQSGASLLRRYQLYDVINAAKRLGVKDFVFGKNDEKDREIIIPEPDKQWLENLLLDEIEKLEALLGPIPQW